MWRLVLFTGIAGILACGGPQVSQRLADHGPEGDHRGVALSRTLAEGAGQQRLYRCLDPNLNDQLTSGTERLTTWTPCWEVKEPNQRVLRLEDRAKTPTEQAAAREPRAAGQER